MKSLRKRQEESSTVVHNYEVPLPTSGLISRRAITKSISAALASTAFPSLGAQPEEAAESFLVYVGNFSSKPTSWDTPKPTERGFGIYRYHPDSGELELLQGPVLKNISVGATHVDAGRRVLYCTHEFMTQPDFFKGGGGSIYALSVHPRTGELQEIDHKPSYGALPSYPAMDATGKYLIVVNYTGGTPITRPAKDPSGHFEVIVEYDEAAVVLFPLGKDGSIGDPCYMFKRPGSGPGPEQTHSRFHSVMRSPLANIFLVCDWGSDRIYIFRIDAQTSTLKLCEEPYTSIPGSKPRYSAFHATQPFVFVNHEGKLVVSAFRYSTAGHLQFLGTTNIQPPDVPTDPTAAQSDMRLHPSGAFLYTIIRGVRSIVSVLSVDPTSGALSLLQCFEMEGGGPRGCAISPDGLYLYVALTSIQKVVVLRIAPDGKLSSTGKSYTQSNPGNVTFFPA